MMFTELMMMIIELMIGLRVLRLDGLVVRVVAEVDGELVNVPEVRQVVQRVVVNDVLGAREEKGSLVQGGVIKLRHLSPDVLTPHLRGWLWFRAGEVILLVITFTKDNVGHQDQKQC